MRTQRTFQGFDISLDHPVRGTARWSDVGDVLAPLSLDSGYPVGLLGDEQRLRWHAREGHITVVGASGSGKTQCVSIPWLMEHKGPAVVIDIKGELYQTTGAHRSSLGEVWLIDPFSLVGKSDGFDPLGLLKTATGMDEAAARAMAEVIATGHAGTSGNGDYWRNGSVNLIQHLLILASHAGLTLQEVSGILDSPRGLRRILDREFLLPETTASFLKGLTEGDRQETSKHHKETALQDLAVFRSKAIESAMSGSNRALEPRRLMDANHANTLYLVIPEAEMKAHSVYLRLVLWCLLRTLNRAPQPLGSVLILVDEIAQLGRSDALVDALTFSRSAGGRVVTMWQGHEQMVALYGEKSAIFTSNAALRLYTSFGDMHTRRELSEELGLCAALEGDSVLRRSLVEPSEFSLFPSDGLLALGASPHPFLATKDPAWQSALLSGKLGPAPRPIPVEVPGTPKARIAPAGPPLLLRSDATEDAAWLKDPKFRAERNVLRSVLNGAPGDVIVIRDIRVPGANAGDPYQRQGDILVADPRGLLCIEVKGGHIRLAGGKTPRWTQNHDLMQKNPAEQAISYATALGNYLKEQGIWIPVRIMLAFPDTPERSFDDTHVRHAPVLLTRDIQEGWPAFDRAWEPPASVDEGEVEKLKAWMRSLGTPDGVGPDEDSLQAALGTELEEKRSVAGPLSMAGKIPAMRELSDEESPLWFDFGKAERHEGRKRLAPLGGRPNDMADQNGSNEGVQRTLAALDFVPKAKEPTVEDAIAEALSRESGQTEADTASSTGARTASCKEVTDLDGIGGDDEDGLTFDFLGTLLADDDDEGIGEDAEASHADAAAPDHAPSHALGSLLSRKRTVPYAFMRIFDLICLMIRHAEGSSRIDPSAFMTPTVKRRGARERLATVMTRMLLETGLNLLLDRTELPDARNFFPFVEAVRRLRAAGNPNAQSFVDLIAASYDGLLSTPKRRG